MATPGAPPAPQSAAPPYPPPYPPYGPAGPPLYPPPPKTNHGLIILVVVIAFVLALVGTAAILYMMVGRLITDGTQDRPFITFGPPLVSGTDVAFQVASASRAVAIGTYSVNLLVNTTAGTPRPLATSFMIVVGAEMFTGIFTDHDGSGTVNGMDAFRITANSGWRAGVPYQFELLWTDHSPVGFRTWTA